MRGLVGLVLAIAVVCLGAGSVRMAWADYFDDGNDREDLSRLRHLRMTGGALTDEEAAIVQAADRVGLVVFKRCIDPEFNQPVNGTAVLIQADGRDAILASAHLIWDRETKELKHHCVQEDLTDAYYLPNSSYYGQVVPNQLAVDEETDAAFDMRFKGDRPFLVQSSDWMLLFLGEQVSLQPAPGQSGPRGYIKFAEGTEGRQSTQGLIVGMDSRQEPGGTTWQLCDFKEKAPFTYHTCDTSRGSSGSLFGVFQDGEIRLQALNNWGGNHTDSVPLPDDFTRWNKAINAAHIRREIEEIMGKPLIEVPVPIPDNAAAGIDL